MLSPGGLLLTGCMYAPCDFEWLHHRVPHLSSSFRLFVVFSSARSDVLCVRSFWAPPGYTLQGVLLAGPSAGACPGQDSPLGPSSLLPCAPAPRERSGAPCWFVCTASFYWTRGCSASSDLCGACPLLSLFPVGRALGVHGQECGRVMSWSLLVLRPPLCTMPGALTAWRPHCAWGPDRLLSPLCLGS